MNGRPRANDFKREEQNLRKDLIKESEKQREGKGKVMRRRRKGSTSGRMVRREQERVERKKGNAKWKKIRMKGHERIGNAREGGD